jgi:thymidylate synthase ThyX
MTTSVKAVVNDPRYKTYLDHGFVGLIDVMGSDEDIVRAAKVSYGGNGEELTVAGVRRLIRYLMRKRHTSPIEMSVIKFHMKIPIFVMRQHVRTRTACLTGDSELLFVGDFSMTVKRAYNMHIHGAKIIGRHTCARHVGDMELYSLNETTKELYYTNIKDIWESGVKHIFEVTISTGKTIRTSKDHLFFTENGWKKLEDIAVGDNVWELADRSNFGRLVEVTSITHAGKEMTYDIEVAGPFHNFSANTFVVHNSLNEYSGRYSEMSPEFYVPEIDRFQFQDSHNKQGSIGQLEPDNAKILQDAMVDNFDSCYASYKKAISSDAGLAKEIARIQLPVSNYTELYWKIDLHNFLHYIKLRNSPGHAQWEIVQLAQLMYDQVKEHFPLTAEAFEDYVMGSVTFSRHEANYLASLFDDCFLEHPETVSGIVMDEINEELSVREKKDFIKKIEQIITGLK